MRIIGKDISGICIIFLVIFISSLFIVYPIHAGPNIVSVDSTAFPNIKVNVYVPCHVNLTAGDFNLKENGKIITNKNVSSKGRSLDLVVVFDDTGSMHDKIDVMKSKVQDLISQINSQGLDTRYSLVTFKDEPQIRMTWESNADTFKSAISDLVSSGGDDTPEASLDAIEKALTQGFRPKAQKVILVVTDAPAHQKGDGTNFSRYTEEEVRKNLVSSGATLVVVSPNLNMYNYVGNADLKDLANMVGGTWIDMSSGDFKTILNRITTILTGTYVVEYTTLTKAADESKTISIAIKKPPCDGNATFISPPPVKPNNASAITEPTTVTRPRFFYAGDGMGGTLIDPFYPGYNVTVTKDIRPPTGSGCQDIVITVTTPSIPSNKRVVFALDDSGSTLQSGISDPMMNAIANALNGNPDVKYARVDWHDASKSDWDSGQFYPASHWSQERLKHDLQTNEEYNTAYAGGLQRAVSLLKAEQASASSFDKKTTAWIIVFITGASEYNPSQLAPIIADAKLANISIYSLGVGIYDRIPTLQEYKDLNNMSTGSNGQFYFVDPNNVESGISDTVNGILQKSFESISTQPVAKNVIVTDSIYPYLKVTGTNMKPTSSTSNSDGTTTLVWNLGDMSKALTKTIVINTALEFNKLPIDVSNKRTAVSFSPGTATPSSLMTYTAITDEARTVPLPEGELTVFCGSPPSSLMANIGSTLVSPAPATSNTSTRNPPGAKSPGFEGWIAIGGLMALVYLLGRRNELA